MKTTRFKTFETNSSSSHSISISNDKEFKINLDGIKIKNNEAFISGETEFGLGPEEITEAGSKIYYLLVDQWDEESNIEKYLKNILGVEKIHFLEDWKNGYVDHQSSGTSGKVNIKQFFDFVFNPDSILNIDNDNH